MIQLVNEGHTTCYTDINACWILLWCNYIADYDNKSRGLWELTTKYDQL